MEQHLRVDPVHPGYRPGDQPDRPAFPAADPQVAGDRLFRAGEFRPGAVGEVEHLLRPPGQQLPVRGQRHLPAAPQEQRLPQLRFQPGQLFGKGGLGDVQYAGGFSDVPFPRDREEVA